MADGPLGSGRGAREPDRGAGYERGGEGGYYGPPPEGPGTSWISVFIGWLAAVGASVILIGIVSGVVGGMLGVGSTAESAGTVFAVGVLIALFIAFPYRGLRCGSRGEPFGHQARPAGGSGGPDRLGVPGRRGDRGRIRPLGRLQRDGDTGGAEHRPTGVEYRAHALQRPRPDPAVRRRGHRRVYGGPDGGSAPVGLVPKKFVS